MTCPDVREYRHPTPRNMRLNWITPSWRGSRYFTLLALLLLLSLGLGSAGAAAAPGRYEGVLGNAPYLINVPPDWNGGLVMFAHGYQGEGAGRGMVHDEPLDQHLTERGYAWAASGYRAWGYHPDWFLLDLLALRAHFINRFGKPRWTIIHGQSMGGHVSIASLELHPEMYQGALIECGVIDGIGIVDWLYAYTAAAQYFSGLPLLDTPRPEFDELVYTKWLAAMGEPGYYTDLGRRFDSVVKYLAGGDVPLRLEQDYRRRAEKAGTSHLLVQRAVRWPGHCGIDGAVRERAFDDLVAWVENATVPAGDDVLGDVGQLGLRWTPLRHPKDPIPQ